MRPALDALAILGQSVAEHLRPGALPQCRVELWNAAFAALHEARGLDPEAQQPALERAVPENVRAMRTNAELHAELGRAREDRRLPAGKPFAQDLSELAVNALRA